MRRWLPHRLPRCNFHTDSTGALQLLTTTSTCSYQTADVIQTNQLCCCRSFLRSLDQRNLSNGAAEMLKMACIKDAELFGILEEHADDILVSKFQVCGLPLPCAIRFLRRLHHTAIIRMKT